MKVLITKIPGMSKYENIAIETADFIKTNAVIVEEQDATITAELSTGVPKFITTTTVDTTTTETSSSTTTPAALLAIQWKNLPQIDSQIFKVLLYALGDNGLVYNQLKDNQQLDPSKAVAPIKNDDDATAANSKATTAQPEVQEEMDDWDADEPEQEEMDDWG
eukprot:UN08126